MLVVHYCAAALAHNPAAVDTLLPERKGDDPRRREERIAALLDDPGKLRELHRRQIERREARKAARRRRKGRYQVRSMRM